MVEAMLKKNIPVVFAYIADAHDNQEGSALSTESTFGPGEAPYVKQLKDYDAAFAKFFADLKSEGIDQTNTLFVFTPDEGDHFVGSKPTPANCDGVNVPCTYANVGELDINLAAITKAAGNSTKYSIHFDDAPTVYVLAIPAAPIRVCAVLEQLISGLSAVNPITGQSEKLTYRDGRSGHGEDAAHGNRGRSESHADVHAVRRS